MVNETKLDREYIEEEDRGGRFGVGDEEDNS